MYKQFDRYGYDTERKTHLTIRTEAATTYEMAKVELLMQDHSDGDIAIMYFTPEGVEDLITVLRYSLAELRVEVGVNA